MGRDVLPSRLIAFWLGWHYKHHKLAIPGFAREVKVTPAACHNWISGERGNRRGISEKYWPRIARFFGFTYPEQLIGAARALYEGTTGGQEEVLLEQPTTPALVREFLRDGASERHPLRRAAPAVKARKSRGIP